MFQVVESILARVRSEGDAALIHFTEEFDRHTLTTDSMRVSEREIANALSLAEQADSTAAPARTFGDAASMLSAAGLGEVSRVQLTLTVAHAQITAWRVELEQTVASVEAQNLQHRQRALQRLR